MSVRCGFMKLFVLIFTVGSAVTVVDCNRANARQKLAGEVLAVKSYTLVLPRVYIQ